MSKILILVEGQTEEAFVKNVLAPHLAVRGIYLTPKVITTSRTNMSRPTFKDGVGSYNQVKGDLIRLLGDSSVVSVTTMLDFYGLPTDFPDYSKMPTGSCFQQVEFLETAFTKNIANQKFIPYLALHEFEAMLFVSLEEVAKAFPDKEQRIKNELLPIKKMFVSPEEINNNRETAPSKRLEKSCPGYQKTLHGPLIARNIGLERIRQECLHFNQWLEKLEQFIAS